MSSEKVKISKNNKPVKKNFKIKDSDDIDELDPVTESNQKSDPESGDEKPTKKATHIQTLASRKLDKFTASSGTDNPPKSPGPFVTKKPSQSKLELLRMTARKLNNLGVFSVNCGSKRTSNYSSTCTNEGCIQEK